MNFDDYVLIDENKLIFSSECSEQFYNGIFENVYLDNTSYKSGFSFFDNRNHEITFNITKYDSKKNFSFLINNSVIFKNRFLNKITFVYNIKTKDYVPVSIESDFYKKLLELSSERTSGLDYSEGYYITNDKNEKLMYLGYGTINFHNTLSMTIIKEYSEEFKKTIHDILTAHWYVKFEHNGDAKTLFKESTKIEAKSILEKNPEYSLNRNIQVKINIPKFMKYFDEKYIVNVITGSMDSIVSLSNSYLYRDTFNIIDNNTVDYSELSKLHNMFYHKSTTDLNFILNLSNGMKVKSMYSHYLLWDNIKMDNGNVVDFVNFWTSYTSDCLWKEYEEVENINIYYDNSKEYKLNLSLNINNPTNDDPVGYTTYLRPDKEYDNQVTFFNSVPSIIKDFTINKYTEENNLIMTDY